MKLTTEFFLKVRMYYEKKVYYLWEIFNGTSEKQIRKSKASDRPMSFVNGSWQGQMIYHYMPEDLKAIFSLSSINLHFRMNGKISCSPEEYQKYFDKYEEKINFLTKEYINKYPKFFDPIYKTPENINFLVTKFATIRQEQDADISAMMIQNELLYSDLINANDYQDIIIDSVDENTDAIHNELEKINDLVKKDTLQLAQNRHCDMDQALYQSLINHQYKLVEVLKKYNQILLTNIKKLQEHSYVLLDIINKSQAISKSQRFKFTTKNQLDDLINKKK